MRRPLNISSPRLAPTLSRSHRNRSSKFRCDKLPAVLRAWSSLNCGCGRIPASHRTNRPCRKGYNNPGLGCSTPGGIQLSNTAFTDTAPPTASLNGTSRSPDACSVHTARSGPPLYANITGPLYLPLHDCCLSCCLRGRPSAVAGQRARIAGRGCLGGGVACGVSCTFLWRLFSRCFRARVHRLASCIQFLLATPMCVRTHAQTMTEPDKTGHAMGTCTRSVATRSFSFAISHCRLSMKPTLWIDVCHYERASELSSCMHVRACVRAHYIPFERQRWAWLAHRCHSKGSDCRSGSRSMSLFLSSSLSRSLS